MDILILNGNPQPQNKRFDNYLDQVIQLLNREKHSCDVRILRHKELQYCLGCFGCWVKTPGECIISDDATDIGRKYIQSDIVVYASPISVGFTSALLKKVQDRLIPLLHPYFQRIGDDFHHPGRYPKFPSIGLILERNYNVDDEQLGILLNIYKRIACSFKAELKFYKFITDSAEEVCRAIDDSYRFS